MGWRRDEGAADTSPGSPEAGQWLEGARARSPLSLVHGDGQGPAQGAGSGARTLAAQGQEERRTRSSCVRWQLGLWPWKSPLGGFCFLSERGSRALLLGEKVGGSRRGEKQLSAQERVRSRNVAGLTTRKGNYVKGPPR